MNQNILDEIKKESLKRNPEESCGFIINEEVFYACSNTHERNRKEHFKIDPNEYLRASRLGKISHVFHSHTTEKKEFSILDKTISEEFNIKLVLYHLPDDSFLYYEPNGFRNPYIGRKFKWGKYDCFTIVKIYYKEELGIDLNEEIKDRGRNFFEINYNLFNKEEYADIARRNSLEVLPKNTKILKHDILLFKHKDNIEYHFAVYIDDNTYLHVPDHGVSQISLITEEKLESLHSVIRLKK